MGAPALRELQMKIYEQERKQSELQEKAAKRKKEQPKIQIWEKKAVGNGFSYRVSWNGNYFV